MTGLLAEFELVAIALILTDHPGLMSTCVMLTVVFFLAVLIVAWASPFVGSI